jgi:hypothetical protein
MSLTREDLHAGLHRFATKHDLERFATKQELIDFRAATAQGLADLRHHIDLAAEDLSSKIAVMLGRLAAGIDSVDACVAEPVGGEGASPGDCSADLQVCPGRQA